MKLIIAALFLLCLNKSYAQQIASIHFNPLTDSVKKGFNYYINVDAQLSNNKWLPLTDSELKINSSYGTIKGNNLLVPLNTDVKFVDLIIYLKSDTTKKILATVPIKQLPDPELKPIFDNNKAEKAANKRRNKKKLKA